MLGGVRRRLIRLEAPPGSGNARVLIASLDLREGLRVLTCHGAPEDEARCKAAFEAIASPAWRAGVPRFLPRPPVEFVGRRYEAPERCVARAVGDEGGGVTCDPDSGTQWTVTRDPAAEEPSILAPYARMALVETRVQCAIDQAPLTGPALGWGSATRWRMAPARRPASGWPPP